jgi:probable non-F420 flavinoid oxidoreductase
MTVIGFHCSHEQIDPAQLLRDVQQAERAGFTAAMSSDHFSPWSSRQGESGFAWSFLGAALATTALPFGVVNAPGQRYHPAIIAQAIATLAQMFPGRFWAALGTGEASNERVTGDPWPDKPTRNARLAECVDVMRALFAGEEVTHHGLVHVDRARLWTLPAEPPPLVGAAVSEPTARWLAGWSDGLATICQGRETMERVIGGWRDAGGEGRLVIQVHVSWAPTDEEALAIAHDQWRTNVFSPPIPWDLDSVEAFDEAARHVRPEDMRGSVLVTSDLGQLSAWLHELLAFEPDELYVHHVGREQGAFIEAFAEHVLPGLAG